MRNEYEYQSFEDYANENPSTRAATNENHEIAMVADATIGNTKGKTLFDTGTRGLNFISKTLVQVHRIPTDRLRHTKSI